MISSCFPQIKGPRLGNVGKAFTTSRHAQCLILILPHPKLGALHAVGNILAIRGAKVYNDIRDSRTAEISNVKVLRAVGQFQANRRLRPELSERDLNATCRHLGRR